MCKVYLKLIIIFLEMNDFFKKCLKEPIEFKTAAFCQSYSLNIYITKVGSIRMNEFNI